MAARIARTKQPHDDIITTVYRTQADALEIEALAKRRLADEYDAAQKRGEVQRHGGNKSNVGDGYVATAADLGLRRDEIQEARLLRDAEQADPGIVRRTPDDLLEQFSAPPTKFVVSRFVRNSSEPMADDTAGIQALGPA